MKGSKTNTVDTKAQLTCFQRHLARKDHGFVFAEQRRRLEAVLVRLQLKTSIHVFVRRT